MKASPAPAPQDASHRLFFSLIGFALAALLLVDILYYGSSTFLGALFQGEHSNPADGNVPYFWISLLVNEKFSMALCLLAGWGMMSLAQQARAARRNRFLAVLACLLFAGILGVLHGLFIWAGDFMTYLVIIGLIAIPFIFAGPRLTLAVVAILLLWQIVLPVGSAVLDQVSMAIGHSYETTTPRYRPLRPPAGTLSNDPSTRKVQESMYRFANHMSGPHSAIYIRQAYEDGPWWKIFVIRPFEFLRIQTVQLYYSGLNYLAIFLLGMWAVKASLPSRIHQSPHGAILFGLALSVVGIFLNLPHALNYFGQLESLVAMHQITNLLLMPSTFLLAVGYTVLLAGILSLPTLDKLHGWLAPMGRCSLTLYVLRSIPCTLLFYPYGLGLYNQMDEPAMLLVATAFILLQMLLARIWMRSFNNGPVEILSAEMMRRLTLPPPKPLPPPLPRKLPAV